jgi:hypothetical protein
MQVSSRFKTLLCAVAVGCCLAPLSGFAARASVASVLTHMKALTPERTDDVSLREDVGAVALDGDVFERLALDRTDLRVLDAQGTEIPMLLRRSEELKAVTRVTTHRARITAFVRQQDAPTVVRAELPGKKIHRLHAIELAVPIKNFERQVTVSVSTDMEQWTEVATLVPIYDYTRFVDLRRTTIAFEPTDARGIKLAISSITDEVLSPLTEITREIHAASTVAEFRKTSTVRVDFRIDAITARERVSGTPNRKTISRPVPVTELALKQHEGRQETTVTFQTRRQPVKRLVLASATSNFSRRVTLEGRWSAGEGAWQTLATGQLSQIGIRNHSSKALALSLAKEARCGEYRLVIRNQDSPPLSDIGVSLAGPVYECVFFLEPAASVSLYYGGNHSSAPHYDIAAVLSGAPSYECKIFGLEEEEINPDYRILARTRTALSWRILFILAITLAVLGLSWTIIHMAKGIKLDVE